MIPGTDSPSGEFRFDIATRYNPRMATVTFTQNIQRHIDCPPTEAPGDTVAGVLNHVFELNPTARGYVLDEHGALRKHMAVFVDGQLITDRTTLSDPVSPDAEVYILQALSGG